ncbi:hypothetical protein ACM9HF_02980 [Colwellia sp. RE-S-Sl-9]
MRSVFVLLIFVLSGCATAPKNALNFDQVNIPQSTSERSTFIFNRLFTPPAGSDMRVSIDGVQIVALPNNTFSYVQLEPGQYNLKISWSPWTGQGSSEKQIFIPKGKSVYLQLGSSVYTPIGIELGSNKNVSMEESSAISHLRKCCKYIPAIEL